MTPASLEGQTLGKYRVMEPLGRGGMARVYRAYHPQLDRYVAIKVLRSDLVEDEEFLHRFRREARSVAALRHPHVVQVYDSDVEGEVYYIVLELLEGDSLKTRLADYRIRDERMPLGDMVRVILDVLDGLAYAHSEKMIHRDIKPANILLTKRGEAVVTDFGIAQIVGGTRHTASGAMMGTLNYMAPEQGLKGQSDVRSDIYSLGIVCYEMLTRQVPFDADTPLAVLMKHLNDPLPLPRKIEPAVPASLERVVLKALAKQPEDRYQRAEEMREALIAAAGEAGIEIPQSISLPLSFTTPEAPAESVAVFSGTARERITDVHFADDDTDTSLGKKLSVASADVGRDLGTAGKDLLGALGTAAHVALAKTTDALRDATGAIEAAGKDESPVEQAPGEKAREKTARERQGPRVAASILGALGIVLVGNTCMLTLAVPFGLGDIYGLGWPIELFLICLGLFGIMYVTSSIWFLIPAGVLLGSGILFAYSSLTGNWEAWTVLWIFEIWVVILSIFAPIWLARSRSLARGVSRLIAIVGGLLSIGMIVSIGIVVGAVGVFGRVSQLFGL